jgi:hypothetical protein
MVQAENYLREVRQKAPLPLQKIPGPKWLKLAAGIGLASLIVRHTSRVWTGGLYDSPGEAIPPGLARGWTEIDGSGKGPASSIRRQMTPFGSAWGGIIGTSDPLKFGLPPQTAQFLTIRDLMDRGLITEDQGAFLASAGRKGLRVIDTSTGDLKNAKKLIKKATGMELLWSEEHMNAGKQKRGIQSLMGFLKKQHIAKVLGESNSVMDRLAVLAGGLQEEMAPSGTPKVIYKDAADPSIKFRLPKGAVEELKKAGLFPGYMKSKIYRTRVAKLVSSRGKVMTKKAFMEGAGMVGLAPETRGFFLGQKPRIPSWIGASAPVARKGLDMASSFFGKFYGKKSGKLLVFAGLAGLAFDTLGPPSKAGFADTIGTRSWTHPALQSHYDRNKHRQVGNKKYDHLY